MPSHPLQPQTHRSLPSSTNTTTSNFTLGGTTTGITGIADDDGSSAGGLLATLTHGSASCDYVVDAQWCPAHPAAFASATAGGALHLWDLGRSMEVGACVGR